MKTKKITKDCETGRERARRRREKKGPRTEGERRRWAEYMKE